MLQLERAALAQILRRRVFNVLAVNNDDHTKNFSFLLREGGRWELAPAHDITHAYRPDSEGVREHQMQVNGRFDGITPQTCAWWPSASACWPSCPRRWTP